MALFYPRFVVNEYAPVFRLMDDLQAVSRCHAGRSSWLQNSLRSFQPRFDVKETETAYELQGELPGVEQKDLQVEFTSPNTLQIKGRTERHHEQGAPATTAPVEGQTEQAQPAAVESAPSESETSSNYHKPTVEEDFEEVTAEEATMSGANPDATPAESVPEEAPAPTQTQKQEAAQLQQTESVASQGRYWVSERSVGQFARTFKFANRVDQENVKASLKGGILSIVVPKAAVPENKRINIE